MRNVSDSQCERVFITAVPITKLFARGGGGEVEDMCYERLRAEVYVKILFRNGNLTWLWLGGGGGCGLGRGVGVLGGPRAGVDGLCRLCCDVAVGGPFAGGRSSVF